MNTEAIFSQDGITAVSSQIQQLKTLFPACFDKDGRFLIDKFQAEIAQQTDISREFYAMNWLGKSYARLLRNLPPETLISEDKTHNAKPENAGSQNLLIRGDNLEVLKHLKNAYAGSVKMIYIDPPYNTGSDGFVYQDDRKFTPAELARLANIDEDEAARILDFTDKGSNSHSAWLTFMYPRLYIARELLKDDGVIFISIDDNEAAQLKLLCDEVFGEGNFIGQIAVKLSESTGVKMAHANKRIPKLKEYIICYKNTGSIPIYPAMENKSKWDDEYRTVILGVTKTELEDLKTIINNENRNVLEVEYVNKLLSRCSFDSAKNICKTETGKDLSDDWLFSNAYRIVQFVTMTGGVLEKARDIKLSTNLLGSVFSIITPKNKMYLIKSDFNHNSDLPRSKILFADEYLQVNMGDFWKDIKTTGLDNEGGIEFKNGKKPLKLLKRLIGLVSKENDLILDFFAGSGTTAHAVMQLNAEEQNGNRRYICVQLPEKTGEESEAHKAGYPTIFDITKARIEKAAAKIRAEHPDYTGDLGFKVFQTVEHFRQHPDNDFSPDQMDFPFNDELSEEQLQTLLTTWTLYDGAALTTPVEPVRLGDYTAYLCEKRLYLLNKGFTSADLLAFIRKLDDDADFNPNRVIVFGSNMASAMQHELDQAVRSYTNKKEIELNVIIRV